MKHAFLIFAHNEQPILEVLLGMLDDARNDVYLHIDARSEQLMQWAKCYRMKHAGFYMIEPAHKVYWGDISQVEVEFDLYRTAYHNGPYAYYHLLSGVDLPIKSMDAFHDFFSQHQGTEFVEFWDGAAHERDLRRKLSRYCLHTHHMRDKGTKSHHLHAFSRNVFYMVQKTGLFRRKLDRSFRKGAAWASFTNDFCAELIKEEAYFVKRMRRVLCADEFVIPTIANNERFINKVYKPKQGQTPILREIDWERGVNGGPHTWVSADLDFLLQSPNFFARKFSSKDMEFIESLVLRISQQTIHQ